MDHMEKVNGVAVLYLQGKSESDIARETKIQRHKVVELLNEWRQMAANNQAVRARAREALAGADLHYNELIAMAYRVIREAEVQGNLGQQTSAIKLVADMEARRIDLLQRAGMLDNRELADQLAEMEKKYDAMKRILNNVLCPECKMKVMRELQAVSSEAVVVNV